MSPPTFFQYSAKSNSMDKTSLVPDTHGEPPRPSGGVTVCESLQVPYAHRLIYAILFSAALGYVETMVVVYLRALYYPGGFTFPLARIPGSVILLEFCRESATIVILAAISALVARRRWERFGYFLIFFGLWDLFYYVWLKVALDWPASLLDWDVLFLIPLPWIGPVIAPSLIALEMVVVGFLITQRFARGGDFRATRLSWVLALAATGIALWSFMKDFGATVHGEMPEPYAYWALGVALAGYVAGFWSAWRQENDVKNLT